MGEYSYNDGEWVDDAHCDRNIWLWIVVILIWLKATAIIFASIKGIIIYWKSHFINKAIILLLVLSIIVVSIFSLSNPYLDCSRSLCIPSNFNERSEIQVYEQHCLNVARYYGFHFHDQLRSQEWCG